MQESGPIGLDVLIFGGGGAGLWLLDVLVRDGYDVLLLESDALGSGQTIASQGIIHGGLKYTLTGLLTHSARAIREMPLLWRRSLAGEHPPDLTKTRLRSEFCYLWQTRSLSSKVAMIGARAGLRVRPRSLSRDQRPPILADCPGTVARLDEQVIEPMSLLTDLGDRHRDRILKIDAVSGLEFDSPEAGGGGGGSGGIIRLIKPDTGEPLELKPRDVVLTAGEGNGQLRRSIGLSSPDMQTRPLHMVMCRGVRGDRGSLPLLNGHCVDGRATRLTITSTIDYAERTVWQIGGQIAERGVSMEPSELIAHAAAELRDVIPGVNLDEMEWNTYRVNRAEQASASGHRPADVHVKREGRTITAWPTKLALVPRMAGLIQNLLEAPSGSGASDRDLLAVWPRPGVALPPWERQEQWFTTD